MNEKQNAVWDNIRNSENQYLFNKMQEALGYNLVDAIDAVLVGIEKIPEDKHPQYLSPETIAQTYADIIEGYIEEGFLFDKSIFDGVERVEKFPGDFFKELAESSQEDIPVVINELRDYVKKYPHLFAEEDAWLFVGALSKFSLEKSFEDISLLIEIKNETESLMSVLEDESISNVIQKWFDYVFGEDYHEKLSMYKQSNKRKENLSYIYHSANIEDLVVALEKARSACALHEESLSAAEEVDVVEALGYLKQEIAASFSEKQPIAYKIQNKLKSLLVQLPHERKKGPLYGFIQTCFALDSQSKAKDFEKKPLIIPPRLAKVGATNDTKQFIMEVCHFVETVKAWNSMNSSEHVALLKLLNTWKEPLGKAIRDKDEAMQAGLDKLEESLGILVEKYTEDAKKKDFRDWLTGVFGKDIKSNETEFKETDTGKGPDTSNYGNLNPDLSTGGFKSPQPYGKKNEEKNEKKETREAKCIELWKDFEKSIENKNFTAKRLLELFYDLMETIRGADTLIDSLEDDSISFTRLESIIKKGRFAKAIQEMKESQKKLYERNVIQGLEKIMGLYRDKIGDGSEVESLIDYLEREKKKEE